MRATYCFHLEIISHCSGFLTYSDMYGADSQPEGPWDPGNGRKVYRRFVAMYYRRKSDTRTVDETRRVGAKQNHYNREHCSGSDSLAGSWPWVMDLQLITRRMEILLAMLAHARYLISKCGAKLSAAPWHAAVLDLWWPRS